MTVDDGIDLAVRGISAAIKRDAASGNGIEVGTITKKGFEVLDAKEVEKRIAKMKL